MFGIGMPELILILALALILIGPKKLPDLAKSLGRALGEFKRATNDLKDSLEIDHEISEVKKAFTDVKDEIQDGIDVSMGSDRLLSDDRPAGEDGNLDRLKSAFDEMNEPGTPPGNGSDASAAGQTGPVPDDPYGLEETGPVAPKPEDAEFPPDPVPDNQMTEPKPKENDSAHAEGR